MQRRIWILAAYAGALATTGVASEPASAQRPGMVESQGDAARKRIRELAKSDPAAAEREALRLIAEAEAGDGLGTEYALDIGDALRSIYGNQRRDGDQIALLERFYRWNVGRFGVDNSSTLEWAVRLGFDLEELERFDEAETWLMRVYEARKRMNANPVEQTQYELLQSARALAHLHDRLQRWDKAESFWLEVIAISTAMEGAGHRHTLEWMGFLARSYGSAGQSDKQIALLRRTVDQARTGGQDDDGYYANRYSQDLAEALEIAGRRDEALAITETVDVYDQAGADSALERLSSSDRRRLLMTEGRFDDVEKLLLADLALMEAEGRDDWLTIPVIGLAEFHDTLRQYDKSEIYWRRAIALSDAEDISIFDIERQGLAKSLTLQGRYADAEQVWRDVLARQREALKDNPNETDPYQYGTFIDQTAALASVVHAQGRPAEAEEMLLDVLGRGQIDDQVKSARDTLASIYVDQGRFEEALVIYQRLRDQSAGLVGDGALTTRSYDAQIAEIRARSGDGSGLIPVYESNVRAYRQVLGDNDRTTRYALTRLASLYADAGRLAEAQALLEGQAVDLTVRDAETFSLRNQRALLAWQQGRGGEAIAQLSALTAEAKTLLGPTNPSTLVFYANAVELAMRERAFADALPLARQLVAGLDEQRVANTEQLANDTQLAAISSDSEDGYKLFADSAWSASLGNAQMQSNLRNEAFAALQNAMTSKTDRAIARSVARRLADQEGGALAELIRRMEAVQQLRDSATRAITASFSDGTEASFRLRTNKVAERDRLSAEFTTLDSELRKQYPDYFALVRADPVSLDSIAKIVTPEEALLLIMPGPRGTHVMAVIDGQLYWHRALTNESEMDQRVRRMLYFLGGSVKPSPAETAQWLDFVDGGLNGFDRGTALLMYQDLIAPFEDKLAGKSRLIVAAGGSLASLPFSVLVTGEAAGADDDPQALRQTPWLAEKYALVQIPSIQSFAFLRARRDTVVTTNRQFVGFGDPLLTGRSIRRGKRSSDGLTGSFDAIASPADNASRIDPARLRALSRLPGTSDELKAMGRIFGSGASTVLLAEQSTETNVKQTDLTKADVLAFATHALTTGEIKGAIEPGLVFTPPLAASAVDDGYLTASEVSQLRLSADWVILSACNTAAGDGGAGSRGLSGLARSFFYAGAGNRLASHWPVRDDVAARLTVRIIEIGRDNPDMSRADAFQRAMREIRQTRSFDGIDPAGDQQSWAHPNAWAPFMLIGDGR